MMGGRVRVAIDDINNPDNPSVLIVSNSGGTTKVGINPIRYLQTNEITTIERLKTIYGVVHCRYNSSEQKIYFEWITLPVSTAIFEIDNLFANCGFVEGQARIITDYGSIACIVKNGTLYPIITEYDQQIEDNNCISDLYLNGDNEVSGLQDMVDQSGRYLPYDNTTIAEPWSPVENYLHQNVNMPIVPKIGFEPSPDVGIGNALPGLNYEVTL